VIIEQTDALVLLISDYIFVMSSSGLTNIRRSVTLIFFLRFALLGRADSVRRVCYYKKLACAASLAQNSPRNIPIRPNPKRLTVAGSGTAADCV
jgi:hypothetical protein